MSRRSRMPRAGGASPRAIVLHACLVPAVLLAHAMPGPARAAQSDDSCTGFIGSVPAAITQQGTWCLRHDLSGNLTYGEAIDIRTNNVTIDCNHFKLGNLAAGAGTAALGIAATDRRNITVRNCIVRGFSKGIALEGAGGGHLVEDNILDGNTSIGLSVLNDGSIVRRNRVLDTGGSSVFANVAGILTTESVDIVDNTVSGVVAPAGSNGNARGIRTWGAYDASVSGNRVRGVQADGTGISFAVSNQESARVILRDNDLSGDGTDVGISCHDNSGYALQNTINGFVEPVVGCAGHNNVVKLP